MNRLNYTGNEISCEIEKYSDLIRRICFINLKNKSEVEDIFQEVFLKYFLNAHLIHDEKHLKAWLCQVAFNKCKDSNKSYWHKNVVSFEGMDYLYEGAEETDEIIKEVLQLPPQYKEVIYLHYYEGYTIPEIAEIMRKNTNTVYTILRRAKLKLKKSWGDSDK